MEKHRSDIRASWNVLKSIINRNKKRKVATRFKINNNIIENPEAIADKFNEYFINIGPTLAKDIPSSDRTPSDYLHNRIQESFFFAPVLENEILMIISKLKNSSSGWDCFETKVIKEIKTIIVEPLVYICNLSISTGIFPYELKLAQVVPIFKAGDDEFFSNYRPVSILSVFSKIFEKIVYQRLLDFLNKHGVLYAFQFGFRQHHSTYMALLTLVDRISTALDEGKIVVGIFWDFSKAFDTVDHKILSKKLEHYGIRGICLNWFIDYLSNRKQLVTYNGAKSKYLNIKCGVPQGSILGPLLFLIYINDLPEAAKSAFLLLFADDSNLFFTGNNINEITCQINKELDNIIAWLDSNKNHLILKKRTT